MPNAHPITPLSAHLNRWLLLAACVVIALTLAPAYTGADDGAAPETATQADRSGEDSPTKKGTNNTEDNATASEEGDTDSTQESGENGDPEKELVSVSFNGASLNEIAGFFMDQLGKPVLIDPSVKEKEISIMSRDQLPPAEAFELIGTALRGQGVIMVENARHLEFLPIEQIGKVNRRLIPADQSTADVINQAEIVDKVFQLSHYDPARLKDVIAPMLPEYAIVLADANTRRLIVTDAAANLQRIEQMVRRLDVPQANQTVEKIIPVKHGDASEIVSMLRIIIAGSLGEDAKAVFSGNNQRGGSRGGGNNGGGGGASVILMGSAEAPILLRADLARNRILAVAPPNVMEQIERWVKELDLKKDEQKPYMLIDIEHADIAEVSQQIMEVVQALSVDDAGNSVRVIPFTKSRQLLVYGSQGGRDLVMSLLKKLDVESSRYQVIEEIVLKHDSAENVKSKIEDLFSNKDDQNNRRRWWGRSSSNNDDGKKVKVTADTQRNTVTILTDPNRMERIRELIAEQWDLPIDLDAVKPKVYELAYIDPVQLKTVLEDMFTKSTTKTSGYWYDEVTTESANPVGRLFGQFSFQALRGTNKLIVSSKSSDNYAVIDGLIEDLDQPQAAGLPIVIELKHANAEDLAEQLNAMFSEPGTPAAIARTPRGLNAALRQAGSNRSNNSNNQNNNPNNNRGGNTNRGGSGDDDPNALSFWWSQARSNPEEQPTSNLIGKPRFIPISRRNAIAFLAPMAYGEPLREMIGGLDQPGMQVMIRAIITEVEHNDETTLGIRIASDPGILSDARLGDQALGGSVSSAFADTFGAGRGTLNAGLNLNVLMQLLIRKFDLKILNEPRVYTADNQEAHFFDGQDVPVIVSDQSSRQDAATFNRSFDYQSVGTRLHVRPHITQQGEIDLEVNLELSRIESGDTVFGNFIFNRREYQASVTLKDGQTVVLSGIVRQEDFKDVRKLPILGDIPLLGGLFRSTDKGVRNREVIVFITPQIVKATSDEAQQLSDRNKAWLEQIRGTMEADGNGNGDNPLKPGVLDAQPSDPADRAAEELEYLPAEIDDRLPAGAVESF